MTQLISRLCIQRQTFYYFSGCSEPQEIEEKIQRGQIEDTEDKCPPKPVSVAPQKSKKVGGSGEQGNKRTKQKHSQQEECQTGSDLHECEKVSIENSRPVIGSKRKYLRNLSTEAHEGSGPFKKTVRQASNSHMLSSEDDVNQDDANSGKRCSRRHRLAPTLFWLGQRVEYRTLVNGTREVVNVGSVPTTVAPKGCKVQKKNPLSKVHGSGGSKQHHSQQMNKSPQHPIPSPSESIGSTVLKEPVSESADALICHPNDIVMRNKNHGLPQETDKVKMAQCVSTLGVRAGCLELDVGASIGDQVATKYSTVYFVLKGSVHVEINKKSFRLPSGSFFIIQNGSRFNITNITSTKASLTYCNNRQGSLT